MYFLCEETDNIYFCAIENILQVCSEGFNSHFQKEQLLHLARIKSYRHYKLSIISSNQRLLHNVLNFVIGDSQLNHMVVAYTILVKLNLM